MRSLKEMKEIKTSGLPVFYEESEKKLVFQDRLTCAGRVDKFAGQMRGLLYNEENLKEDEYCYTAYRDIVFEEHRALFQKYNFRYDITVIDGGTVNGEKKKTSGHYHGYIQGQSYTYPEVYEVLSGRALYVLQKVMNFEREDEEPVIEELKAVYVETGQAVIIPPFYGHCSINAGNIPLIFSNLAVVDTPVFYEPVKKKHGMSIFLVDHGEKQELVLNKNYKEVPGIIPIAPKQNTKLGIEFGKPIYQEFLKYPEKFDFLPNPAPYLAEILPMLAG
jgi:glucose-6-phosphate isomerase